MTNALVRQEMDSEQVALIKRMIAKDASNDELELFLHQCRRTGLDALSKQIYAISRFSKRENRKVMSIQVSIDGARLIAERTGKYDSQEGPYWCGEDGVWRDVWLSPGHPCAAKVLVYKVGSTRGTTGIAHWSEYADTGSSFWQSKPALMLAKCAESLALRKAFPQELSGLYTSEEMDQAEPVIDVTARRVDAATGEIANNYHVDGDALFAKDAQPARPVASQAALNKMHMLGNEYYRTAENWDKKRPQWVHDASGGAVESSKELSPEQADWIIERLNNRIAKRVQEALAAQQPVAQIAA